MNVSKKLFQKIMSMAGQTRCVLLAYASNLDRAKVNVVRSVNSNMTIAYWLIGKEIVLEIKNGKDRAKYGKKLIVFLREETP